MWCNRWRLPDRVRSGLMYWKQYQLRLHHRALQSDCHELHREVNHDLRVMQGLVFTPAVRLHGQSCFSFPYRNSTQSVDPVAASFGVLRCSYSARLLKSVGIPLLE